MSAVVVVVAVVVVIGLGGWAASRARRNRDGVDSFRRQIDALSPEARRTVVDQVQNAAEGRKRRDADGESGDEPGDEPDGGDGDEPDGEPDGGDGARGA